MTIIPLPPFRVSARFGGGSGGVRCWDRRGDGEGGLNGVWGKAIEVPRLGTLNKGGNATLSEVSCGSPGNCAVGGFYGQAFPHIQAFVVSRT